MLRKHLLTTWCRQSFPASMEYISNDLKSPPQLPRRVPSKQKLTIPIKKTLTSGPRKEWLKKYLLNLHVVNSNSPFELTEFI